MIITIINTNLPLILEPETKLRFKSTNPIFDFTGSYSFPFDLNAEKNCVALGHPERFHRSDVPELIFDVLIESAVLPWQTGRLYVQVSNTTYSCSLGVGESELYAQLREKSLAQVVDMPVDMGEDFNEFIAAANAMTSQNFPDVSFQFPLMHCGEPYNNETIAKFFKFVNYYKWHEASPSYVLNNELNPGLADYPDADSGLPGVINPYNITSYAPCPFVFAVLKNMINKCGYRCPETPPFKDAQINQLLFISNKTIDSEPVEISDYVVRVGLSADQTVTDGANPLIIFDTDSGGVYQDIFNKYDTSTGRFNGYYGDGIDRIYQFHYKLKLRNNSLNTVQFHMRCVSNHAAISYAQNHSIESYTNLEIEENLLVYYKGSIDEISDFCEFMLNFYYFTTGDELIVKAGSTLNIIPISDTLTIKPLLQWNNANYLPDISVRDLFSDLKHLFGIVPFYSRDAINVLFIRDIVEKSPTLDLSQYLLKNYNKTDLQKIKSIGFPNGFDSADFTYTSPTPNELPYSTVPEQVIYMRAEGHFYKNNHDEFYNFEWQRWRNDVNRRQILPELANGDDIVLNSDLPQLIMANHDYTESSHWLSIISLTDTLISAMNKPVNEDGFTKSKSESPDYLLAFWRGLQNDSSSSAYPFASPYVYKVGGSVISGVDTQLRYNGEYGLYVKYLQPYISIVNSYNNIYTIEMNIPASVLRQLRFDDIYFINGIAALIKSIDMEVMVDDTIVQPVIMEVVRL